MKFPTLRTTAMVIAILLILTGLSSLIMKHYGHGLELLAFGVVLLIPVLRERFKTKEQQAENYSISV